MINVKESFISALPALLKSMNVTKIAVQHVKLWTEKKAYHFIFRKTLLFLVFVTKESFFFCYKWLCFHCDVWFTLMLLYSIKILITTLFSNISTFCQYIVYEKKIYRVSIKSLYNLKRLLQSIWMRYRNKGCFMLISIS